MQYHELIPMLLSEVQHQQQALGVQARQLSAQAQQLVELKVQNQNLQAAHAQQLAELHAQELVELKA